MLEKYLQEIGLSGKEASIYMALLSFDKASVADVSQKAGVKRPTTYVILTTLQEKGLVSETTIGKKTFYIAEPPEKLESFVSRQMTVLEENKKSLKNIIPQLKSIQREPGERPVVQFFEGKEGVLSSNNDIFSKKIGEEPVYAIYSNDLVKKTFSQKELETMRERRKSKGIKSKAIYNSKEETRPSDNTGDRIKIDEKKYPITSDITIYGDQVKIAILGKRLSSISIKNMEFADTMKSLMNFLFDNNK